MPAEPAIAVTNLVKSYDRRRVVDSLTITVPPGTVCALLGPNGAGKTTTVECVEGFREPDEGTVRVLGLDPVTQRGELIPRMGVMLQEGGAYQAATPWEMLRLYTRFYADPLAPADVLQRVGLHEVAGQHYRTLSGGQKQRLNLALALIGRPEVVLLDEPTAGMDPQARQSAWEEIRRLSAAGNTVLLTTHFMDEAERLADLVAVIDHGRLLAFDSPAALVARHASQQVLVTTPAAIDVIDLSAAVKAPVRPDGSGRYVVAAGADTIPAISAWFAEEDLPVTGISSGSGGLEAVFLRLTGQKVRP